DQGEEDARAVGLQPGALDDRTGLATRLHPARAGLVTELPHGLFDARVLDQAALHGGGAMRAPSEAAEVDALARIERDPLAREAIAELACPHDRPGHEPVAPLEREPVRLPLRVDAEPEERAARAASSAGDVVRAGALAPRGVRQGEPREPGVRAGMMAAHRLDDHVDRLPDEGAWDVDE